MRRSLVTVTVAAVAFVLAGHSGNAGLAEGPDDAQRTVVANEIGLSKVGVTEDRAPEPFVYGSDGPGSGTPIAPAYDGSPPLVPHSIDGLLPITRDQNWCTLCHASGGAGEGGPPQVPESHFVDWRGAPDEVRDALAGARWVCTSCHVPQSDARLLVANDFARVGR